MSDKITLDRDTFKVLAADTRVNILKSIHDRKKTITDLAEEFGMSPSTIKEHVDKLVDAGLIEYLDRGTKWKYYILTRKGEQIVSPVETKVWILLSTSLIALGALSLNLFGKIFSIGKAETLAMAPAMAEKVRLADNSGVSVLAGGAAETITNQTVDATTTATPMAEMVRASYNAVGSATDAVTTAADAVVTAGEGVAKSAGGIAESTTTTLAQTTTTIQQTTATLLGGLPAAVETQFPWPEVGLTIFIGIIFLATLAHVLKKKL